ncbi:hypothetical protein GCM10009827_093650 [Dactylosporangium maewongense]|uniref:Uncharacterized protein n=1 Tax=Dactylosporangium maewongense TaxID=634393 RepID=A0ABN2CFN9_9ACTN
MPTTNAVGAAYRAPIHCLLRFLRGDADGRTVGRVGASKVIIFSGATVFEGCPGSRGYRWGGRPAPARAGAGGHGYFFSEAVRAVAPSPSDFCASPNRAPRNAVFHGLCGSL